jgi:REP element-mobilizing transposase RayT
MPFEPLAYLLTWTCYGTWLHGDERGFVDSEHNQVGSPFLPPSPPRKAHRQAQMKFPPVLLSHEARLLIEKTIEDHCRIRNWTLLARNVRSNHVHAVLAASDRSPDVMMDQLKAWTTRRLRETGHIGKEAPAWTEKGSKRFLWDPDSVRRAADYVANYQGDDAMEDSSSPPGFER